ncbi:hypothetical protein M3J09_008395 [Ascochyta lentis]
MPHHIPRPLLLVSTVGDPSRLLFLARRSSQSRPFPGFCSNYFQDFRVKRYQVLTGAAPERLLGLACMSKFTCASFGYRQFY